MQRISLAVAQENSPGRVAKLLGWSNFLTPLNTLEKHFETHLKINLMKQRLIKKKTP